MFKQLKFSTYYTLPLVFLVVQEQTQCSRIEPTNTRSINVQIP